MKRALKTGDRDLLKARDKKLLALQEEQKTLEALNLSQEIQRKLSGKDYHHSFDDVGLNGERGKFRELVFDIATKTGAFMKKTEKQEKEKPKINKIALRKQDVGAKDIAWCEL